MRRILPQRRGIHSHGGEGRQSLRRSPALGSRRNRRARWPRTRSGRRGGSCLSLALAVAGRSTHHHAAADVAGQPEDQQNDQHEAEQTAAVVWGAPPGPTAVVVATAAAKEKHQNDNQEDQHDGTCFLQSLRAAAARAEPAALSMRQSPTSVCPFENTRSPARHLQIPRAQTLVGFQGNGESPGDLTKGAGNRQDSAVPRRSNDKKGPGRWWRRPACKLT